jgi:hypothetical protein
VLVVCRVVGCFSVDCKLAEMDCAICSQLDHLQAFARCAGISLTHAESSNVKVVCWVSSNEVICRHVAEGGGWENIYGLL